MIVATAGHIDHGKTVLVRALSGVDTDRLPEEKQRGMSIDLGYAYRPLGETKSLGFVDVPGHERFIANMLAGVTGIDFALLVIAADDGPMPQTREHLAILDLLGIQKGAVAITKIDRVDEARRSAVVDEVRQLIAETSLANVDLFPVSGITGEGIDGLRDHLDEAAAAKEAAQTLDKNFRLAIDRAFTLQGAGLVATGTAFSGTVEVGDSLIVSPEGWRVRVRSLHAQNRAAERAGVGDRCALNITGNELRNMQVRRGSWLVAEGAHAPTARLDVRLRVLESEQRALRHWMPVHVHVGAEHATGRVAVLEERSIAPGTDGWAQLVIDRDIGVLAGDRVIVRDQSAQRTLGGGPVVDPFPPRRGRARPERLEILSALANDDPIAALASLVEVSPQGVDLARFAQAQNLKGDAAKTIWENMALVQIGQPGAELALSASRHGDLRKAVLDTLADSHRREPGKSGMSIHALRERLPERLQTALLDALLHTMMQANDIAQSGGVMRLPTHRPELAGEDAKLWAQLEPLLADENLRPPTINELAQDVGRPQRAVEAMLARAARLGLAVRVTDNRYFLSESLRALGEVVETVAAGTDDGMFSVAEFRDQTSIGRNLAIELLEYFDRTGFTARRGNRRRVVRPARDALSAA